MLGRLRAGVITAVCRAAGALIPARRGSLPAPRRVLVLKPCCLGDVLMTTPLVAALRHAFPGTHLTYAVGSHAHPAIYGQPGVDGTLDCGLVGVRGRYGPRDALRLAACLRRQNFDLAVVPDRSPALGLVCWLARIPERAGLDSAGRGFAFTRRAPCGPAPRYELERYLDVARALGLAIPDWRMRFVPSAEDRRRAAALLAELGLAGRRPAVLAPGGGQNPGVSLPVEKRWPAAAYGALARRLARGARLPVLLVGAAGDAAACATAAAAADEPQVIDLAGRTSFGTLGALLEGAALFVGNDSAALHLAAAVGAPSVGIFLGTDPLTYAPRWRCIALRRPIFEAVWAAAEQQLEGCSSAPAPQQRRWADRDAVGAGV